MLETKNVFCEQSGKKTTGEIRWNNYIYDIISYQNCISSTFILFQEFLDVLTGKLDQNICIFVLFFFLLLCCIEKQVLKKTS